MDSPSYKASLKMLISCVFLIGFAYTMVLLLGEIFYRYYQAETFVSRKVLEESSPLAAITICSKGVDVDGDGVYAITVPDVIGTPRQYYDKAMFNPQKFLQNCSIEGYSCKEPQGQLHTWTRKLMHDQGCGTLVLKDMNAGYQEKMVLYFKFPYFLKTDYYLHEPDDVLPVLPYVYDVFSNELITKFDTYQNNHAIAVEKRTRLSRDGKECSDQAYYKCLHQCSEKRILSYPGACSTPWMAKNLERDCKTVEKLLLTDHLIQKSAYNLTMGCPCTPKCTRNLYRKTNMMDSYLETSGDNIVIAFIFYSEKQVLFKEEWEYTLDRMLGSWGGIIGIFYGFSLLTVLGFLGRGVESILKSLMSQERLQAWGYQRYKTLGWIIAWAIGIGAVMIQTYLLFDHFRRREIKLNINVNLNEVFLPTVGICSFDYNYTFLDQHGLPVDLSMDDFPWQTFSLDEYYKNVFSSMRKCLSQCEVRGENCLDDEGKEFMWTKTITEHKVCHSFYPGNRPATEDDNITMVFRDECWAFFIYFIQNTHFPQYNIEHPDYQLRMIFGGAMTELKFNAFVHLPPCVTDITSYEKCRESCAKAKVDAETTCSLPFYPGSHRICDTYDDFIESKNNMTRKYSNMFEGLYAGCDCGKPCSTRDFKKIFVKELAQRENGDFRFIFKATTSGSQLEEEQMHYTFEEFFGDCGGSLGLYTGLSLMSLASSVIEIIMDKIRKWIKSETGSSRVNMIKQKVMPFAIGVPLFIYFCWEARIPVEKYIESPTKTSVDIRPDDMHIIPDITICWDADWYRDPTNNQAYINGVDLDKLPDTSAEVLKFWRRHTKSHVPKIKACTFLGTDCMKEKGDFHTWRYLDSMDKKCSTFSIKYATATFDLKLVTEKCLGYIFIHARGISPPKYYSVRQYDVEAVDICSWLRRYQFYGELYELHDSLKKDCEEHEGYDHEKCIDECLEDAVKQKLNCTLPWMNSNEHEIYCTTKEQFNAGVDLLLTLSESLKEDCTCPSPCDIRRFQWFSDGGDYELKEKHYNIRYLPDYSTVFFVQPAFTFSQFWAEIGGTMGMLIGTSLYSLYCLLERFFD